MPNKNILFFSCEPGGAAVLIPVIRLFQNLDEFDVTVVGHGLGAQRFLAKGIEYHLTEDLGAAGVPMLQQFEPDLVITSATSLPDCDMTERLLWRGALELNIPTIAFIDQWQNYAIRFSGSSNHSALDYQPDYINCINEIGERDMLAIGFSQGKLLKFGHPYLSGLRNDFLSIDIQHVRERLGLSASEVNFLFVSEAIRENYADTRGYDQYSAFKLFLSVLDLRKKKGNVFVRLHPKDSIPAFLYFLREIGREDVKFMPSDLTSLECIGVADEVFGMSSIMLIEAWSLGKPVISVQPNFVGEDPFLLSRLGVVPRVECLINCDLKLNNPLALDVAFRDVEFVEFVRTLVTV